MHKYLRAIGFSKYKKKKEIKELLQQIVENPTSSFRISKENEQYECIDRSFGNGIGIRLLGEFEGDSQEFREEYYFPYVESNVISSKFPCSVERHTDKNSYGGIIEDPGIGISLIFYLSNGLDYINKQKKVDYNFPSIKSVSLNGLCTSGKILLPVQKTEKEKEKLKIAAENRVNLIEAARNGDEEAMESLALEDMNIFQNVSKRIAKEDVYSLVDTCFMPYGLESDQYSVVGEIYKIEKLKNCLTGEECYRMTMECNRLLMTVSINADDLLGEPAIGRRFKGDIWLQGKAIF